MKTVHTISKAAVLATLLLLTTLHLSAQELDYNTFISRVMQSNLNYAVAKLDHSVAQADLSAAKKFNDPALAAEYGNNSDWDIAMGQSFSFGIEKTISFGKRSARISTALHNLDASHAGLQQFAFTLRAEATLAFIDALLARTLVTIGQQNMQNMQELYLSDSLRFATGDMSEIDVMQTRLEANIAKQDYQALLADYRNALVELDQLMGNPTLATQSIVGNLDSPMRNYNLSDMLKAADSLRLDIVQQRHLTLASESELTTVPACATRKPLPPNSTATP